MAGRTLPPLFVVGPTASGKEALALALARALDGEIVSMDSMKIYRGLDIGTAKPSPAVRAEVPHHLIDVVDPWESFSVAAYVAAARRATAAIRARGRVPIVSGGTPLYLKGLLAGLFAGPPADWNLRAALDRRIAVEGTEALHAELARGDPAAARRIHPRDARRIVRAIEVLTLTGRPISAQQTQWESPGPAERALSEEAVLVGLLWERDALNRRINRRAERMFAGGLVEEVRRLAAAPGGIGRAARQALGYKEVLAHLAGRATAEEALVEVKKRTRRFARRQMAWFRRFPGIRWLPCDDGTTAEALAARAASAWRAGGA